MKILLVYPGQVCSTFDVALGYHEALNVLGHQVCPYNFHDWLEYHEGALNYWSQANPHFSYDDKEVFNIRSLLASEYLVIKVIEFQPDVILIVHGLLIHPRTYDLLNKLDFPKVAILTECPYVDDRQKRMLEAAKFDHIFVNDRVSVGAFSGSVSYLPHSYSRFRHRPSRSHTEYEMDVYFHGTWFEERAKAFSQINGNYNTRIIGVGWEEGIGDTQDGTPNSELIKYYQSTRIALNHHRMTTTIDSPEKIKGESIGPRAYEISACGAFQLCDNARPELGEIFGDSVAIYHDVDDLQVKIEYYLSHENERLDMAREALNRVQPCSFHNRAAEIVLPILEAL